MRVFHFIIICIYFAMSEVNHLLYVENLFFQLTFCFCHLSIFMLFLHKILSTPKKTGVGVSQLVVSVILKPISF